MNPLRVTTVLCQPKWQARGWCAFAELNLIELENKHAGRAREETGRRTRGKEKEALVGKWEGTSRHHLHDHAWLWIGTNAKLIMNQMETRMASLTSAAQTWGSQVQCLQGPSEAASKWGSGPGIKQQGVMEPWKHCDESLTGPNTQIQIPLRQTEKDKYHMISHIYGIFNKWYKWTYI